MTSACPSGADAAHHQQLRPRAAQWWDVSHVGCGLLAASSPAPQATQDDTRHGQCLWQPSTRSPSSPQPHRRPRRRHTPPLALKCSPLNPCSPAWHMARQRQCLWQPSTPSSCHPRSPQTHRPRRSTSWLLLVLFTFGVVLFLEPNIRNAIQSGYCRTSLDFSSWRGHESNTAA